MRKVNVIRRKNKAALIEWQDKDGNTQRGTVPVDSITNENTIQEETVEMAIPAGFPWSELIEISATPELIETNLHRVGIWDLQDLLGKPNVALGAIQAAYKVDLAALTAKARQFQKKHKGG